MKFNFDNLFNNLIFIVIEFLYNEKFEKIMNSYCVTDK